jgi:hypothetical protein
MNIQEHSTLEKNLYKMTDKELWLAYSYTGYLYQSCEDPLKKDGYRSDIKLMRKEVIRRRFVDV